MPFEDILSKKTAEVEDIVLQFLPKEEGLQKTVMEAMNYGMMAGGKRIRPMLMLETYRLFGGKGDVIKPFMAAIEMIHNYSLIHDDLPAMDNDMYRRGKKTTHAVYGETMGILAGDALLNYAYETAATAFDFALDKKVAKALQVLTEKAGIYGMVGGQVVDIESENKAIDLDTIHFIHTMKTGALIESSMLIGAILAGATESDQQAIQKIASNIGLAFQIQDDILDVTSTEEVLGKPIGSDDRNNKMTYVGIKGLAQAKADVEALSNEALTLLHSLPYDNVFLEQLIVFLMGRKK